MTFLYNDQFNSSKINKTDELDLWNKFKDGEDKALSLLYNLYANKLYSYGLKISNDDNIVKDSIQETFINLVDKRKKLIITEKTYLYLFKSLRNKIIEEIRTQLRKKRIEESMVVGLKIQSQSAEDLMVGLEEENSQKMIIKTAIESLSEHQREIIFLKYSEGLNYDDISIVLDIDVASVRTLLYRTLKRMKENLTIKRSV